MNRLIAPVVLAFTVAALLASPAHAQFGKNKITYENFDWQVYESPHFNIHMAGAVA